MQPLKDLKQGLEILEPFLRRNCFMLENYENQKGSGGQFTIATFKNGQKKFIIGYRFSVGELSYQFDNYKVGHNFYLDHLGFADKKKFPDFQSGDKLIAFKHILHDLEFLVDDFFLGSCSKLIEASKLQDKFIKEHSQKAQKEYNNQFDTLKIEQARQKFKEKEYSKSLMLFLSVENKFLLNELDSKTMEYCERHK